MLRASTGLALVALCFVLFVGVGGAENLHDRNRHALRMILPPSYPRYSRKLHSTFMDLLELGYLKGSDPLAALSPEAISLTLRSIKDYQEQEEEARLKALGGTSFLETGPKRFEQFCEVCQAMLRNKRRAEPACSDMHPALRTTCERNLESLLSVETALTYWIHRGCLIDSGDGPMLFQPCPESWVPNLFSHFPVVTFSDPKTICPLDTRYIARVPEEYLEGKTDFFKKIQT